MIEYDPQPPYDAGSADRAPAEIVTRLRSGSRFLLSGRRSSSLRCEVTDEAPAGLAARTAVWLMASTRNRPSWRKPAAARSCQDVLAGER
jgi:hypothetical protein